MKRIFKSDNVATVKGHPNELLYISTHKQGVNITCSWASIHEHLTKMVDVIQQDMPDFGYHPDDYIVALPRGGLPISVTFSHVFHHVKVLTIEEFTESATTHRRKFNQVLLVDEISDSGTTMRNAVNHIMHILSDISVWSTNRVPTLKTAALCIRADTQYVPNFYRIVILSDAWVIFPWEVLNPAIKKTWFQRILELFNLGDKVII